VAVDHSVIAAGTSPESGSVGPVTFRAPVVLVEAGNRIVVPAAAAAAIGFRPEVLPVESSETDARLAWRSPRLEFSRTPVTEAITLINQHAAAGSKVRLILTDSSLGSVEVSGVLRADNIETLWRLLEAEHGIVAERRMPDEVVLRRAH
jgi:ferric-dicitrate binding protein FerR (iron transport regulator)